MWTGNGPLVRRSRLLATPFSIHAVLVKYFSHHGCKVGGHQTYRRRFFPLIPPAVPPLPALPVPYLLPLSPSFQVTLV